MDKNQNDQIAKIFCYGFGCVFAYYVLMWLLPYIALALALYAFGQLVLKSNNRRNGR